MKKQETRKIENLNKRKNIIMLRNTKGITLIALVITIIVLIILAGISINLILGKNGIITKAKLAKTETEQAKQNEEIGLNEVAKYIEEMGASGNTTNPPDNPTIEKSEIEKSRDAGTYMTEKTTLKDSNENLIKVPEGFKIAEDSGINVTEGIVIEDSDIIDGIGNNRGNQYVWVPVGNGIKKSDGTTVDITLGRYTFADGTNDKGTDGTVLAKGTPILKQNAENYTQEVLINSLYKELSTSRTGVASSGKDGLNTTALNLRGFIDSVKANGGYYIARYEASYGTDKKANSKVSNSYSETTVPTTEGTLWNFITQINAATASRNLYTAVSSDLINGYAWNTAIVYIQNFSGDTDYSRQDAKSINSSLTNTGVNRDEVCKINDMASNTMELTTEYSTDAGSSIANPCTDMGGIYDGGHTYTSYRGSYSATNNSFNRSFRVTLYM